MKFKLLSSTFALRRTAIPYIILLGSLLLTAIATHYVASRAKARDQIRFENAVRRTQDAIRDRVNTYVALLQAGTGLFAATDDIDRQAFQKYIERQELAQRYPGIQGVGFSVRVTPDEVDELTANMRQQGLDTFTLHPSGPRAEYHSIIYLEPLNERNQAAIGYDMFTEPVRQAAMIQARDTGIPAASGRVTLVQEIDQDKQAGFLIYAPVYEGGQIPETMAERRTSLEGFVYSPFRANDFIEGIFGHRAFSYVDFQIYDGHNPTAADLLYCSNCNDRLASTYRPQFRTTTTLYVAGHPWTLVFISRPELDRDSERSLVPLIGLVGGLVSLILFGVVRSQVKARMSAEKAAADLRQSEEALRISETRFQTFMDNSPAAAWISDRDGLILYVNQAYHQMLQVPQEVVGCTAHELYDIELADQFVANIRAAADQQRVIESIEIAHRPDGTLGEFLVYKFPIADRWEQLVIGGVAVDITERKQAEEQLRRSELRYRTLIEQSPVSIQVMSPEGKTRLVNRAWENLWGLKLDQVQDYNMLHDQQLVKKGIMPYIQKGFAGEVAAIPPILYNPEETLPGASAYPQPARWVQAYIYPVKDEAGSIREVVLIHEDITERRQAEAELQESEALFRTLIETTFDGIVIHDKGIILDANPGIATMFGYSLDEIRGRSVLDFAAEESRPIILQNVQDGVEESYEVMGLRKDGSTFDIELVGKQHIHKGQMVRVTALRDISDRKQLEAQLRARADQLAETNRLKDEFLATLSHELRTPLNAMLGWTQMLATRRLEAATFERAIETIHRNTRTLTQLIADLLDVSRIITGKLLINPHPTDLIRIIDAAIETVRPAAEAKKLRIIADCDPTVPMVFGDANRLQQIIWNLLSNAVKFTPEDGSITVRLSVVSKTAQIQVSDTGQGIEAHFLPYVFERFRQADGSTTRLHGGLGLGLAIVRHLTELHGGSVSVSSPGLGQGTTFTVSLPLIASAAGLPSTTVGSAPELDPASGVDASVLGELQVLVVDDEADARDLLAIVLREYGAEVITAATADEALAILQCTHPNILISDIGMPGKDGYALMQQIRALDPEAGGNIPAIALTAYAKAEDRRASSLAGFQLHLAKPIEPAELLQAIAQLVQELQP